MPSDRSAANEKHVAAVEQHAERTSEILDEEQQESVLSLARVLEAISADETVAHIDSRVGFLERQIERLSERRDEMDRGLQAELGVMRARVEEALTAVTATSFEQRISGTELERKLLDIVNGVEQRSADLLAALQQEIVRMVTHELSRGESQRDIGAIESDIEEASRDAPGPGLDEEAIAAISGSLEQRLAGFEEKINSFFDSERQAHAKTISVIATTIETRLARQAQSVQEAIAATRARVEEVLGNETRELERGLKDVVTLKVQIEDLAAKLTAAETMTAGEIAAVRAAIDTVSARVAALDAKIAAIESAAVTMTTRVEAVVQRMDQRAAPSPDVIPDRRKRRRE